MKCTICNSEKVLKPAGVSKAGKAYPEFWACPNFKDQKHQDAKREYQQNIDRQNPPPGTYNQKPDQPNGWQVVVEHLTGLETKVDEMINLIKEQLSL